MTIVIPVKFPYAVHDLWFDPRETGAQAADHVVVSTERGTEIGLATRDAFEVTPEELGDTTSGAALRPVLRVAGEEDLARADELARRGEEALPTFRALVERLGLDMKPVGVEYLFGGERVVCYFAAEERVDFRQLVRELSRELHERIDMRQIGVREEAAIVGGYAHCGQELCCARFGRQFEPVSIRMAKEQDLPLNSTKISGACGRLMCCLRYEFEAYRDFKGRAPKKNAVIETPLGKAKIVEYDTPKEELCLRLEGGKQIRVPLAEMEASPAAHKKSEELGCPCRPDTVLRSTLDKINSPQIQMALAELDRKNGVLPDQGFDAADLFVKPARKRRRKASAEPAREADGQRAQAPEAAEAPGKARSRRRRSRKPSQAQQASPSPAEAAPGAQAPRQEQGAQPSRRRRHHRSADAAPAAGAQADRQPGSRRTRRPGDRGGAQAAGGQPQAPAGTQAGAPRQRQEGSEGAPRRRRRHRGGRGRGRGGSGEQGQGQRPGAE